MGWLSSLYVQDKKKDKVSAEDIGGPLAIGGGGTGIGKSDLFSQSVNCLIDIIVVSVHGKSEILP